MTEKHTTTERYEVNGENLLSKVRELIHEGNVRRIILNRDDGTTLIEIPLQAGVVITVLTAAMAPALIAIGAIAAVVSKVTLVVERETDDTED